MEFLKMLKTLVLTVLIFYAADGFCQDQDNVIAAFKSSYELEYSGDYTQAAEQLKNVYSEESYEINARLGWLSYMSGLFTESIAYYQKAIALKPFAIESRFGIIYPTSAAGNWSVVEQQYLKILEIDPMNTYANYKLGMLRYGVEDYEKAFKYFEKVVNLYPFDFDSVIMYAWASLKLGKLREAEVLFHKALIIRPGDKSAVEGLESIR